MKYFGASGQNAGMGASREGKRSALARGRARARERGTEGERDPLEGGRQWAEGARRRGERHALSRAVLAQTKHQQTRAVTSRPHKRRTTNKQKEW